MTHPRITSITSLSNWRIIHAAAMPEETIRPFPDKHIIVCGSLAHFKLQFAKAQVRRDLRADLDRQLDALAKRVGVDRSTLSE